MVLNAGIVQPHSSAEPLVTSLNRVFASLAFHFL